MESGLPDGDRWSCSATPRRSRSVVPRTSPGASATRTGWPVEPGRPGHVAGADDVSMQLYTSGTTGLPKGRDARQRNIATMIELAGADAFDVDDDHRSLVAMPLFHIGGSGGRSPPCRGADVRHPAGHGPGRAPPAGGERAHHPRLRGPGRPDDAAGHPGHREGRSVEPRHHLLRRVPHRRGRARPLHERHRLRLRPGLRHDRDVGRHRPPRPRGPRPRRPAAPPAAVGGQAARPASRSGSSTPTPASDVPADAVGEIWTRSRTEHGRLLGEARGDGRDHPRRGLVAHRATPATSTTRATSSSTTGSRTWSSPGGRTSTRPRWRTCCSATRRRRRRGHRRSRRQLGRDGEGDGRCGHRRPTSRADAIIAFCRDRLAHYKCPTSVDFVEIAPPQPVGEDPEARAARAVLGGSGTSGALERTRLSRTAPWPPDSPHRVARGLVPRSASGCPGWPAAPLPRARGRCPTPSTGAMDDQS